MAFQFSVAARNAAGDAIETAIGASPVLELWSGPMPASCAEPATGTLLVSLTLPADWLQPADGGVKMIAGPWQGITGLSAGTARYFRLRQGTVCHIQGSVSVAGEGGDMIVETTSIAPMLPVVVTAFAIGMGGL
jgi:hypothetical protein